MLPSGRRQRELDPRALQKFFAYGYMPAPNALVSQACRKLPGGMLPDVRSRRPVASASRATGVPDRRRRSRSTMRMSRRWSRSCEHCLSQAVTRRLISDVPLGCFLSGGIDSSTVLALAAQRSSGGTSRPSRSASRAVLRRITLCAQVAAAIGTRHHERACSISTSRATLVPRRAGALDEPLGDASILPTYLLARFTREHVTVALSGDGGDELFAGYDPFQGARDRRALRIARAARHCIAACGGSPSCCRSRRAT